MLHNKEDPMEQFRMLDRGSQVVALHGSEAIGIGIHKHWVAHYYSHRDYFVALCSTKCGIDFTKTFRDGADHDDMIEGIAITGLPPDVKSTSRATARHQRRQAIEAGEGTGPHEPFVQAMERLGAMGLDEAYAATKDVGRHLEYARSLSWDELVFLRRHIVPLGHAHFQHYEATYHRLDDLYCAACHTHDGKYFGLAFRDGRPYADMLRAGIGP